MNAIENAIRFAVKAHEGALRKGTNLPYILHPLEAAAIAAQMTDDQDIIAAAVLHDVIEDTETTAEDIQREFGARVADLVSSNTENKRRELPASATWQIRKQETIEHLKTASRDVKIVAFADKLSNLRAMVIDCFSEGESFWDRFKMKDPHKHTQSSQLISQTGCIGHLRGDMDTNGEGFFTSWTDHMTRLKTDAFKEELEGWSASTSICNHE